MRDKTIRVMKKNCWFRQVTRHTDKIFPYTQGEMRCRDTGILNDDGTPSERVFEFSQCWWSGIEYCFAMGLTYDFGLNFVEMPTGSGNHLFWPECCSFKKKYEADGATPKSLLASASSG